MFVDHYLQTIVVKFADVASDLLGLRGVIWATQGVAHSSSELLL